MKFGNKISILLLVLAIGCFIYAGYMLFERYQPQSVTFQTTATETETTSTSPDGLIIPTQNISLSVYELIYKTDWPLSKQGIVNLKNSNVFYGHNWPNLLGNLKHVTIGDEIRIHYSDNHVQGYTVTDIQTVWPNQTEVLDAVDAPDIILYTCIGFLDTQRLVVAATPQN